MRASERVAIALTLGVALVASARLSAHRRDELLQAARIAIEPSRVQLQLDLTPGIEVADAAIADIDRNRDGVLSPDEQRQYVANVLSGVTLDVDGVALRLGRAAATFPDVQAFTRGEGTIQLRVEATPPPLLDGVHRLSYRNRNRPDVRVYLANALVPEDDRVAVHGQRRDMDQRDLTIEYALHGQSSPAAAPWSLVALCAACGVMLVAGVYHRRLRVAHGQS